MSTVNLSVPNVDFWDALCRGNYPPAELYPVYAEKSTTNLLDRFKSMQIDGNEDLTENGEGDHEHEHEVENGNFYNGWFYYRYNI